MHLSHPFAISTDNEVDILELRQDLWYYTDQEVHPFPIGKSGDEDDIDLIGIARLLDVSLPYRWIGCELVRVDSVRYRERLAWIELCSEYEVVFACVAYTYRRIQVPERPLDQFVEVDARKVVVAEE